MPTYEYLCRHCGHRFEAWQHMTDDPLTVCPACGAEIHRVLYPAGIVFKGSGFYKTDNGSSGKSEKSSSPASKSESGDKNASGESNPAAESSKSKSDSSGSTPSPTTAAAD
ncbi:MAG TPA: FmdB family zinc ribbon protein [Ktedonobacterales bacterium]